MSILMGNRFSEDEMGKWESDSPDKVKLDKLKAAFQLHYTQRKQSIYYSGGEGEPTFTLHDIVKILEENT